MDKGILKRIIIWALLLVIFATLSVLGIIKYYEGYGKYGAIRKELLPIVNIFNESNNIKNSESNIKAKISNDQIIVNYYDDATDISYYFKYNNNILSVKYDVFYTKSATYVIEAMVDAISVYNGNIEGSVFKKYKLTDFYSSDIKYGIRAIDNGKYINFDMNIHENIINNLVDVVLTPLEVTYITVNDLSSMTKDLLDTNTFSYTKNNVSLFVINNSDSYDIYASDKVEDNKVFYESLMSVISLLNSSVYDDVLYNGIRFNTDLTKLKYTITINPEYDEALITIDTTNLVKISIKK